MENGLSLLDFKQFMKQKKWIIIITMIFVTVALIIITLSSETVENEKPQNDGAEVEGINDISDTRVRELLLKEEEKLSQSDIVAIKEYLFEDAYEFRVYIENQDGSVYGKANLTKEILLSDQVISTVQDQIDTELEMIRDYFIDIEYNSNNAVYTISIGAGNQKDSQLISDIYFDILSNDSIPVLSEKLVYHFEESPVSVQHENNIDNESSSDTEVEEGSLLRNIVLSILVGSILGLVFGILLAYIYSMFETKIHALYNLNLQSTDMYISFSGEVDKIDFVNEKLLHVISYPTDKNKLLLCQNKETLIKLKDSLANINYLDATYENEAYKVSPESHFNEVIIITEDGTTDKEWYQRQRNQVKVYKSINKIIRL